MGFLDQLLLSSFPWILGTFLAAGSALLLQTEHRRFTATLMVAGVGGPIGYLIFAAILTWGAGGVFVDYSSLAGLKIISAISFVGFLYVIVVDLKRTTDRTLSAYLSLPQIMLAVLLIGLLAAAAYCILWLPAIGYDVLDHWAPKAHQLIALLTENSSGEQLNDHRHPNTLKLVLAWTAWTAQATETNAFLLLPWLLMTLSLQLVLISFTVIVSGSLSLSLFVAIGAMTTPLLESHLILAGYAELPITVFLSSSCAFIAVGMLKDKLEYQILGIILALVILSLKGSGLFFAILPLISLSLTYGYNRGRGHHILLACLALGSLAMWAFSFVFEVNGNPLGFDGYRFRAFGWRTGLTDVSALEILRNILHAYFVNSSFSILPFVLIVFCLLILKHHGRSEVFLALTVSVGVILLAATQLTSYGLRHASVESDTGNSRFSMPVLMLVWLLVPYLAGAFRNSYRASTRSE